jgi:predicted DNA-binding transcriptional regulator AlpA
MSQEAPFTQPLWDARDVAAFLKVSRSWVYHQAEAGILPYLRIGGLLRFDAQKIRDLALGDALSANIITANRDVARPLYR